MTADGRTERQALNRTALVTGASEGLGRAFATQLAGQGYRTLCVARNEGRLQALVAELGEGHRYHVADLATDAGVESTVAQMQRQHVDLFVNNAGFSRFGAFHELDFETEEKILRVNIHAATRFSHAFLQQARAGDALINLSSVTHSLTTPIQPTYCATKSYIASFSESLWYQARARGVYVQALLPGITRTRFIERSSDIGGAKKRFLDLISQTPEAVVRHSLNKMHRRSGPVVVPGPGNRLLILLLRCLPRKWVVYTLGRVGDLAD